MLQWCYQMKCLMVGERPGITDGGWGAWSSWSRCSRTCGSGVAYAVRKCNQPSPSKGGSYCVGDRKRHKICATNVSFESARKQLSSKRSVNFRGLEWIRRVKRQSHLPWDCYRKWKRFLDIKNLCDARKNVIRALNLKKKNTDAWADNNKVKSTQK